MRSGSPKIPQRQCCTLRRLSECLLVLGIGCGACQHQAPALPRPSPKAAPVSHPTPPTPTPHPLASESLEKPQSPSHSTAPREGGPVDSVWTELPLEGHESAVLWYRSGAPVFVVTHGAGGHAEWHCEHFHRLLEGRATLVCPRGKRRFARDPSQGYYYPDHIALRREVLAAVGKLESLASNARPYVYAGYSQGATMGALAFADSGGIFDQLLLVEGGFADWSSGLVSQFQRSGGQAVLWICGTASCNKHARAAARRFTGAELRAKVSYARGAGHRPDGAVGQILSDSLPFLLEGDARWQGFTPRPESASFPRGE